MGALRAELDAAVKADADLGHALPRFPFDPYSFCGNDEAAFSLAMGLQKGQIDSLAYFVAVPEPGSGPK